MARIVRGSTKRQLTEMCRQFMIKLGIVSTVTNVTGTGIHFLAHTICVFVRSLIRKAKYFFELWRYKRESAWLLAVSYAGKSTWFNDAIVWVRPQFLSIQRTDFFVLHQRTSRKNSIYYFWHHQTLSLQTSYFLLRHGSNLLRISVIHLPNEGREKRTVREPLARTTRSIFLGGLDG
jgi:hypothetical protein